MIIIQWLELVKYGIIARSLGDMEEYIYQLPKALSFDL